MIPLAGLLLLPCLGLSVHWRLNPQYHFGCFVPIFALYTAVNRARTRPPPEAPMRAGLWLAVAVAVALLPTWLLSRPNPDWPFLNWLLTAEVAAIVLGAVAAIGGRAWLRHFAVPVALIFTAVPWPDMIETPFTQWMMRIVASAAVALLDLTGVGALQHGNLIEVATGVVGVDEACSGIRSFQGSLMASLVLGELFRFNVSRRVALLVASVVAAFVTNVIRASFLAWSAAQSGLHAVERWHDPAGMTILLVCVGIILAVALFLDRDAPSPPVWAHLPRAPRLPAWFAGGLTAWLALTVAAVELWYYDPAPPPESPWQFTVPAQSTPVEIPVKVRAVYHSDEAVGATWKRGDGSQWLLYCFGWKFGPSFSRVAAGMHRPDLCLPAGGRELHEDRGIQSVPAAGGATLPFHAFTFRDGDRFLFVYHGLWQYRSERGLRHGPLSINKIAASVQSVMWRESRIGQQAVEVVISGYWDAARADAAFRELVPTLVLAR
ncbi:MAG TPA: exosortase/archaeosortase family protein [Chthoniobacteraceae bacterium]|nr:exosortase/archaeosortase family protein [Chthoniobacteraceae bacterium]